MEPHTLPRAVSTESDKKISTLNIAIFLNFAPASPRGQPIAV
jgi:hypothetical protein